MRGEDERLVLYQVPQKSPELHINSLNYPPNFLFPSFLPLSLSPSSFLSTPYPAPPPLLPPVMKRSRISAQSDSLVWAPSALTTPTRLTLLLLSAAKCPQECIRRTSPSFPSPVVLRRASPATQARCPSRRLLQPLLPSSSAVEVAATRSSTPPTWSVSPRPRRSPCPS